MTFPTPLALVWGIRGGPHFYRRADLAEVEQALCPVSERDAERRSAGAAKKVQQMLTGWADMAAAMWTACADPAGKGVVSGRLHQVLRDELQVDCRPCGGVVHPHEQLFRLSALHGGIELEPGTNPPVLRRIPGWTPTPWATGSGSAGDPAAVPPRYQIARAYLRLLGPATPKDLSGYLDTTVTEAKTLWPSDAIEVDRAGGEGLDPARGRGHPGTGAAGRPGAGPAAQWLRPVSGRQGSASAGGRVPAQRTLAGPGPSGRARGRRRTAGNVASEEFG